jgi:hypothetical protein
VPVGFVARPAAQRPVVGDALIATPSAGPHRPFTAGVGAEHDAVAPPFAPVQLQLHGPPPLTADTVPAAQRLDVGLMMATLPLAAPHRPFVGPRAVQADIDVSAKRNHQPEAVRALRRAALRS